MKSFPFDSHITGVDDAGLPVYDRASTSEDLARWFACFFTNGIFATGGFTVSASGLEVNVSPGDCLINGRYGYESDTRTLALAHGDSKPRLDSVVLRLDLSLAMRKIDLYVKPGTPADTPVAPQLTREATVWELGLANILVGAGQEAVTDSAVTDTRLDNDRCGLVAQAMHTIDTSTFYRQIQADLAEFKATEQEMFAAWFASVQATLDGDVAGNLLNLISAKASLSSATVTLAASGWIDNRQTVIVGGVTAKNHVVVTPSPSSHDHYGECAVRCTGQSAGKLMFGCISNPDIDMTVNVMILDSGAATILVDNDGNGSITGPTFTIDDDGNATI